MPSTLQNFEKRQAQGVPPAKGEELFTDRPKEWGDDEGVVAVQVIHTYHVTVEGAKTPEEAVEKVRAMTSEQIKEEGKLQSIDVDYIEAL